ncbi:MAG: hypothetical protein WCL51_01360 [Bacteroidota bacterium]
MEEFIKQSDGRESNSYLNEIFTFLYELNEKYATSNYLETVLNKEKISARSDSINSALKTALELIKENIKFDAIGRRYLEHRLLIEENEKLKSSISRAQGLIDDANNEKEKIKKSTINETRKKLQIVRDRLVSSANTSSALGEQINNGDDTSVMIDTINNIISSISEITEEITGLGLWPEEGIKPNTKIILHIENKDKVIIKEKTTKYKKSKNMEAQIEKEPEPEPEQISL